MSAAGSGVASGRRPALFLDRDGTVVRERNYLSDPEQVALVPGAAAALRRFRQAGYALVIVTNQSGIARGLYTEADYRAVEARVEECLAAAGVTLDGVYFCPHHPDFTGPCACRKPGLELYERASRDLNIDPARSIFVGDKVKDVLPAQAFGGTPALVQTGYGREEAASAPDGTVLARDLSALAEALIGGEAEEKQ